MFGVQEQRFEQEALSYLNKIVQFIYKADQILPEYKTDTRERDKALQTLFRSESLLSGVVSGAVSRDKNRGWTLTGTARQVAYFSKRLHSCHNNLGWRQFVSMNSTAWYTTNLGYVSDIGFKYENGPADTMWSMDSTRLRLTSNPEFPLIYYPKHGKQVKLKRNEYIHANSMPSFEEDFNYAGFCALERCLNFTRIMIGVTQHHLEKLGVTMPKGILFGTGIRRSEFQQAAAQYKQEKLETGSGAYDGVMGLFAQNPDAKLSLIALSQLPDNFSLVEFIDILMQSYALAFGFPVGEFWSIQSGSFGRTGELNVQQEQAYAKGEMDFALSFQEQLQTYFLPSSLSFNFESRNDKGYQLKAEIDSKRASIVVDLYTKVPTGGSGGFSQPQQQFDEEGNLIEQPQVQQEEKETGGLLSKEEGRQLLVDWQILPKIIAKDLDGDEEISDIQESRYAIRHNQYMLRQIKQNPDEPIVMYRYSPELKMTYANEKLIDLTEYEFENGAITVLYEKGKEIWG